MARTSTLKAKPRRRRWERVRTGLIIAAMPFLMLLALVTMPIWGPLLAWDMRRQEKRMRVAADATPCERCGQTLGAAAIERANDVERERMARFQRDHPGMRMRHIRTLRAVCVTCGACYAYDEATENFRWLPEERAER